MQGQAYLVKKKQIPSL